MTFLKFVFTGILFGIVMTKSQAISWWRMQEMFRFQSFHMYGIIGTAVCIGVLLTQWIKRKNIKDIKGNPIVFKHKTYSIKRYLFGGIVFGIGWALSGACPGPMFTLLGNGATVFVIVIISALAGTYVYGKLRDKLPH